MSRTLTTRFKSFPLLLCIVRDELAPDPLDLDRFEKCRQAKIRHEAHAPFRGDVSRIKTTKPIIEDACRWCAYSVTVSVHSNL